MLVCNCDLLTNVDFGRVMTEHEQQRADITICVRRQEVRVPYGVVEYNDQQILSAYREKPTLAYSVSMGIYVIHPSMARLIAPDERIDMPDLHLRGQSAGKLVRCSPQDGIWYDIGALEDYERACQAFAQDPATFLGPAAP